ncbi:hypothetical protein AVEN_55093-1 [Araneus ventricosus]|uniref:Uncharacterized protein n=1 Tax=Araneus ventricosus TaxID=182803 RepID=A0A4Y2R9S9_ARAVE|nr:hypothetical protein AVEN_55093-1 [Araneus ventricosus]
MAAKGTETRVATGDADAYIVKSGLEKATSHPKGKTYSPVNPSEKKGFAVQKVGAKIGKEKITVDPLTLFHRICVVKQSDEDLKMFFTFDLSSFPLSLFNEERMRKRTKSSLFSAFTPTKIDAVQGKNNFVVVDRGHLLHKVGWQRNMNFGDIPQSCLTYLQTHYGSNVAVVFDGYPSDVNGKSTKSAKRIRRANLQSSHEIIFNEATCPEISQEQFLANERNKNDNIFVVGENIDFFVLLTGLAPMKENLYFRKCGKGRTPDVLYSTTSFKYKFSRMILFIHAFSGCDATNALFGHGKTKVCSLLEKSRHLEEKIQVFFNSEATIDQVANAGETFMIIYMEVSPEPLHVISITCATPYLPNQQLKQGPL